jgi:hypothetical protein
MLALPPRYSTWVVYRPPPLPPPTSLIMASITTTPTKPSASFMKVKAMPQLAVLRELSSSKEKPTTSITTASKIQLRIFAIYQYPFLGLGVPFFTKLDYSEPPLPPETDLIIARMTTTPTKPSASLMNVRAIPQEAVLIELSPNREKPTTKITTASSIQLRILAISYNTFLPRAERP